MLSIRTQDRMALVPYGGRIEITTSNRIAMLHTDGDWKELGAYATKERSLEVLDEIEQKVSDMRNDLLNSNLYNDGNVFYNKQVYQMPSE